MGWRGLRERWGRIGLGRGMGKGEGGVRMAVVAMGDSVRVRELVEDEVLKVTSICASAITAFRFEGLLSSYLLFDPNPSLIIPTSITLTKSS